MLTKLKRKMAGTRLIRKALDKPVDLEFLKKRPSVRFLIGIGIVVLSYLLAWPLIGLLGIIAVRRGKPAIFAVGSPIAYGISTLVFLLGWSLAGKDAMVYMRAFGRLLAQRIFKKYQTQNVPGDPSPGLSDKTDDP
jgi:hypothetical protein